MSASPKTMAKRRTGRRPMSVEPRNVTVCSMLSRAELAFLDAEAARLGITRSAFIADSLSRYLKWQS